jgi:aspartyl-tRNA(Asn)/glutamyl-tRNA(Gln) amidotransferase subunit B
VRRQIELIEDGGKVVQATRLYDPDRKETREMRSKEDAQDYRYFPDPTCRRWSSRRVDRARQGLDAGTAGRHARALRQRIRAAGIRRAGADASKAMATYFEAVVARPARTTPSRRQLADGRRVVDPEPRRRGHRRRARLPAQLAAMLKRIADGTISNKTAKEVFAGMWEAKSGDDTWSTPSSMPRA